MRQNHTGFFHALIIALFSCIVLAGCGYKTDPVHAPNTAETNQTVQTKG
jgi:predicted small lipoprotein YifL